MNWERYRSTMEQKVIKIDDMASEDAYFMATHMPFANLEVIEGGKTSNTATQMSEDTVYEQLVCNPDNHHRLVIVRGDNGTGKSHLIRYLKARFENDAVRYNPDTEQLIFLRRLNNSVRGAFSQLLEQRVIKDPDIENKLRKFIDCVDSRDEASFKTDILYSFIAAVANDTSNQTYTGIICRNITQYLSDSRVQDHLLRDNGAIFGCYQAITAPNTQVLKEATIFTEEDFMLDRKVEREILKIAAHPGAQDFAGMLHNDVDEINKLVKYLNHFTPKVIQRCADISSESTKNVFEQLRRDLKKQGKNLMLFIEDFTGFTGIDSELITVLSTEHGGVYSDLCRVTAFIGITNGYYDQFKDNFKDRVTHQISVVESSYGTVEFLSQMAAQYLNAIYCSQDDIRKWFDDGARRSTMPVSSFKAPCEWETVAVGEYALTLYPFNRKAIFSMYESLPTKTPRMFLLDVIRSQLKEYFDGKEYGSDWEFPSRAAITGNLQMKNAAHSSNIDRLDMLTQSDKLRLKTILELWGDGSAQRVQRDSIQFIGGVNKAFFTDIGLSSFEGVGDIRPEAANQHGGVKEHELDKPHIRPQPGVFVDQAAQRKQRDLITRKDDIEAWFTKGTELRYFADYRRWLLDFVRESINWQAEGIPAYVAHERLAELGVIYIAGQSGGAASDKTILFIERSVETKDVLNALCELNYAGGWIFDTFAYFQQRLITWLERSKPTIIEKVCCVESYEERLPIVEWCLAIQYLKSLILGYKVDTTSSLSIIQSLLTNSCDETADLRGTDEWNDVISFVGNEKVTFDTCFDLLRKSINTTLGAISVSKTITTPMYRTDELLRAVKKLVACRWDIEKELPDTSKSSNMLLVPVALLRKLYSKVAVTMAAEQRHIEMLCSMLTVQVGELTEDNLVDLVDAIQKLYATFNANQIPYGNQIKGHFEGAPIEKAREILGIIQHLKEATTASSPVERLQIFSSNGSKKLADFMKDLQEAEKLAQQEQAKAERELHMLNRDLGIESVADIARTAMIELYERLEGIEVHNDD